NEDVRSLIRKLRWVDGFICPRCGHNRGYTLKCRPLIQCMRCRKQVSATSNTGLHGLKSLLAIFKIVQLFCNGDHKSASQFSRDTDVHVSTGWILMHKVRTLLGQEFLGTDGMSLHCGMLKMALIKKSSEPDSVLNTLIVADSDYSEGTIETTNLPERKFLSLAE